MGNNTSAFRNSKLQTTFRIHTDKKLFTFVNFG